MSVRMDPIQVLPKEVVITHLISTLSFTDIKSCIRVCTKWRVLFNDDTIYLSKSLRNRVYKMIDELIG